MEIKKVGVLGCGLMGSGIAQVAAGAGFETVVREVSNELLEKGFAGIEKSLARFAEKGTITAEQQKAVRDRLSGTTSFADLGDCDITRFRQPLSDLLTRDSEKIKAGLFRTRSQVG